MADTPRPMTKTAIVAALAEGSDLSKDQINKVLESLTGLIKDGISEGGPGSFSLPGLLKIERKDVPAKEARNGVPNPFKPGETMDVAAKPASVKVKIKALKGLKDLILY